MAFKSTESVSLANKGLTTASSEYTVQTTNGSWEISNFLLKLGSLEAIESDAFLIGSNRWRLLLRKNKKDDNWISTHLRLLNAGNEAIQMKFDIGIFANSGITTWFVNRVDYMQKGEAFEWFSDRKPASQSFQKFIGIRELTDPRKKLLTKNGSLRLTFDISTVAKEGQIAVPTAQQLSSVAYLQKDLDSLVNIPNKFTDVTFTVGNAQINAHRAILACRSTVFCELFERDQFIERFDVDDIEPEVFIQMLRFIYTGELVGMVNDAGGLLTAASNYGLVELQMFCEQTMLKQLTLDNAVATLIAADKTRAGNLKVGVIEFVRKNGSKLVETPEWKAMLEHHPNVVRGVYTTVVGAEPATKKQRVL